MKLQRLLLFFVFYFFVNILLQGQDKKNTKYQEHPITIFSFNLGAEHKFFIPKKLLVSAGINYKLTNIYDLEFGFLNTLEVVFKVGKL